MVNDLIRVPRADELGPYMRALTERQQRFVVAMVELGGQNNTRAALLAGYANNDSLRSQAWRLASDLKVQAAIHEVSMARLHSGKILAVSRLLELVNSNDEKVAHKAAVSLMDRTGLHAVSEHNVKTQDVSKTDDAMIDRIITLANRLGLDPNKLLGSAGVKGEVIDGEFKEVKDEPEPEEWEK